MQLVKDICEILLDNYDKRQSEDAFELMLSVFGRKTYRTMLVHWQSYGTDISRMQPGLDDAYRDILRVVEKYADPDTAATFREKTRELINLGLMNFEMYYLAVINRRAADSYTGKPDTLYIDECLNNAFFYEMQRELYSREKSVLASIKTIMTDKRLQPRLQFQIFFYDLICRYRIKTMDRLLDNYRARSVQNSASG